MRILVVGMSGRVLGLDRATGEVIWRVPLLDATAREEVSIAVGDGFVFASTHEAHVFALDYTTGVLRWTADTTGVGRATILVDGEDVFVAKGGHVDCYARATGAHRWGQRLESLTPARVALGLPGNVQQADDPGAQ